MHQQILALGGSRFPFAFHLSRLPHDAQQAFISRKPRCGKPRTFRGIRRHLRKSPGHNSSEPTDPPHRLRIRSPLWRRANRVLTTRRLSGFRTEFVGLLVGFLELPDKQWVNEFNNLRAICRVCRVFLGVESAGEIGDRNQPLTAPLINRCTQAQSCL
jgi:hypothetical protein